MAFFACEISGFAHFGPGLRVQVRLWGKKYAAIFKTARLVCQSKGNLDHSHMMRKF